MAASHVRPVEWCHVGAVADHVLGAVGCAAVAAAAVDGDLVAARQCLLGHVPADEDRASEDQDAHACAT